jgi:hypothetical protein
MSDQRGDAAPVSAAQYVPASHAEDGQGGDLVGGDEVRGGESL